MFPIKIGLTIKIGSGESSHSPDIICLTALLCSSHVGKWMGSWSMGTIFKTFGRRPSSWGLLIPFSLHSIQWFWGRLLKIFNQNICWPSWMKCNWLFIIVHARSLDTILEEDHSRSISQLTTDQGMANVHFWWAKKCAKPWNQRCTS